MEHRRWAFTFNNYTQSFIKKIKSKKCKELYTYIIMGKEIGKEGTRHLQCYIELKRAHGLIWMKNKFHKKVHWEGAKYGAKANKDYCSKENRIYEWGKAKRQGARNDITQLIEHIENGNTIRDLCRGGYIKSGRKLTTAERLMKYFEPKYNSRIEKEVYWIWGPPGAGKSKWVYDNFDNIYEPVNLKWWEGYDRHNTVFLDDFRDNLKYPFEHILKIMDRYPKRIECKGGSRQLVNKVLIFTSPFSPLNAFNERLNEEIQQIIRRIKHTIKLT